MPSPRVLMLIPSLAKQGIAEAVRSDAHPIMDYYALQEALHADILDYGALEAEPTPTLVRIARRFGKDAALAALGYSRRNDYDLVYSNGENVGIPLAALMKRHFKRPGHLMIGHKVSTGKKRILLRGLQAQMDAIFVYATPQYDFAQQTLRIPAAKLHLIPFHADHQFYRPMLTSDHLPSRMICSAGLEWRDYPTLLQAVGGMDVEVRLAAASPWSKHRNETENRVMPPNVTAQRYEYEALRRLYAEARFVVVPLYENDFQAGITTILEGMAMGKAIITTRTTGQVDTIREGENGLYVAPGDVEGWRIAIQDLLDNPAKANQLGQQARQDIETCLSLEHWVKRIVAVAHQIHTQRAARVNPT